jgi:hypothetical protein
MPAAHTAGRYARFRVLARFTPTRSYGSASDSMSGVESTRERRPPLARETRLLLMTILVSLAALWVLARIRFAERPVTPNPITPVLTQLAPPPVFEQLSSAVFQVESRLSPLLMGIEVRRRASAGEQGPDVIPALRLDGDIAVALLNQSGSADDADLVSGVKVIAMDPTTGLAVLGVPVGEPSAEPFAAPVPWSPRRPEYPRFLVAGEISSGSVSVRPVFVGGLQEIASPVWSETIWVMPASTGLIPGTFVFTTDGAFAGLVASEGGRPTLVPGEVVKNTVDRLRLEGPRNYGQLGIEAQPLTPALASNTGAQAGVVLTWVDPQGPAAGQLNVTDVIVAVGDEPLSTYEQWRARTARLTVGESIVLSVRRGGQVQTVTIAAHPVSAPTEPRPLGLTTRTIQRVGVEVLRVAPASAAALAGIEPGDVITSIGDRKAPTSEEARRVFEATSDDGSVLVAITRGASHHVLLLKKP